MAGLGCRTRISTKATMGLQATTQKLPRSYYEQEDSLLRSIVKEGIEKQNSTKGGSTNNDKSSDIENCNDATKEIKWGDVAKQLGGDRKAKQCRDRWSNHLRPGIKKGKWEPEEENLLNSLYATFGPK